MFFPTSEIQLRDIQGVATGNTAIINCPKGPRYRKIILALQDTGSGSTAAPAVSAITTGDINIVLGSKVIRRATGTQIDLINTTNGSQYASYGVRGRCQRRRYHLPDHLYFESSPGANALTSRTAFPVKPAGWTRTACFKSRSR